VCGGVNVLFNSAVQTNVADNLLRTCVQSTILMRMQEHQHWLLKCHQPQNTNRYASCHY
jgi:hypothetical protein